jgi:hypothetical protein
MRPVKIYCGQASLLREISDPCSVSEAERIRQNDESVSVPVLCHVESAVQPPKDESRDDCSLICPQAITDVTGEFIAL